MMIVITGINGSVTFCRQAPVNSAKGPWIATRTLDVLGMMLVLQCQHRSSAQHPAELTCQIATPQRSRLALHRAIALGFRHPSVLPPAHANAWCALVLTEASFQAAAQAFADRSRDFNAEDHPATVCARLDETPSELIASARQTNVFVNS
jgi:hypothetical protein